MWKKNSYLLGIVASTAIIAAGPATGARGQSQVEPPEKITLTTDDGVQLSATYYPSTLGNKAVPVVMLADHAVAQSVYAPFAQRLQSPSEGDPGANIPPDTHQSFAVLTVDLRGHGDSLKQKLPNGTSRSLDASKLNRQDLTAMVAYDMKAVRKFLVGKNDDGKLNINALSIVGAELGSTVAVNWAAGDWSWPALATGKQGQDVKALVLISPAWKFRGLSMQQALRQPGLQKQVAVLMIYGEQGKQESADVKRIYDLLEKYHPGATAADPGKLTDLAKIGADVKIQGTQLLKSRGAENLIIQFLQEFVVAKDFPWSKRRPD